MYVDNSIPSVTVDTAVATSAEILYGALGGGRYQVPAGSSITTLTWYDAPTPGGTYVTAYDEYGGAIVQTVSAGKSYEIPTALEGAAAIKAVGNAAGTIVVTLKG